MNDPVGFFLLLVIGLFAVVLGLIGLRSGTAVTIFRHSRRTHSTMFWYSLLFQFGLGGYCLFEAIKMLVE